MSDGEDRPVSQRAGTSPTEIGSLRARPPAFTPAAGLVGTVVVRFTGLDAGRSFDSRLGPGEAVLLSPTAALTLTSATRPALAPPARPRGWEALPGTLGESVGARSYARLMAGPIRIYDQRWRFEQEPAEELERRLYAVGLAVMWWGEDAEQDPGVRGPGVWLEGGYQDQRRVSVLTQPYLYQRTETLTRVDSGFSAARYDKEPSAHATSAST